MGARSSRVSARAVGRAGAAAGVGHSISARAGGLSPGACGGCDCVAGGSKRQGQGRRQGPMRLLRRRRIVTVERFDAATGRWVQIDATGAVDRDELTVATFNIWFDNQYAEQRYLAI